MACLETPVADQVAEGVVDVAGWAWSKNAAITEVRAAIDGGPFVKLRYGANRPDVVNALGTGIPRACGFAGRLQAGSAAVSVLRVQCVDDRGRRRELIRTVQVRRSQRVARVRPAAAVPVTRAQIAEAGAQVRERLEREPSILEWDSGAPLAEMFPRSAVFSPPDPEGITLPYLDRTVDIAAVSSRDPRRIDEARRVAAAAVMHLDGKPTVWWQQPESVAVLAETVSIIIPVFNQASHTDTCLTAVTATLPPAFRGEILVVDDGSEDETQAVLRRWAATSPLVRIVRSESNQGFVEACNRGAHAATGDVLVFLNNDTRPQPNWLPPLLVTLRRESAGAVGGKLLYPDGALQEAGGVIFADGSGCNFGWRDPHPNAPLFNFVREVDYCSAALLAIRRALFLEMEGFDDRYKPAYYEDVDLCFRLRARGLRVYYQPDSVVVHVEGATSGTDVRSGVKRHQAINRATFVDRWRAELATQPPPPPVIDAPALAVLASRPGQPRALVAAPLLPEFDREGGSQRVLHLIELLRHGGWAVSFFARDASDGERYARLLRQSGVATYAGPDSRFAEDDWVEDAATFLETSRFNLAILAFWETAEALLPLLRSRASETRVIIDSIDLHFLRAARGILHVSAGHSRGTLDADFADRMVRELNVYATADAVLTVSQKEADVINDFAGDRHLAHAVPLMEEVAQSSVTPALKPDARQGLLFVGNFRHAPNLEGLQYFCRHVLPRLDPRTRAAHPLIVVGNEVDERVSEAVAGLDHVRLVGWVPSLAPYLASARLSVIPLLHGAGTKTKLIQALMAGTPTVSTTIGVEGLAVEDGHHVLVADTPDAFAASIEQLVRDDDLWSRIATEGRTCIERDHSRPAVRDRFQSVIDRVMKS